MRKSRFLTVMFGFMPGAGHMYIGLMKKGSILMAAFLGVIFLSSFFSLEILVFALPVIWFYSFFDTLNLSNASYQEQIENENKFVSYLSSLTGRDWKLLTQKRHKILGWGLIAVGLALMIRNILRPFMSELYDLFPNFYQLIRSVPTLVVSVAIIVLGVYILRGNKPNLPQEEDFKEFEGKQHE